MEIDWKKVISQYESIRQLGQTNMMDKGMVQKIAYENEFYELVNAIEDGKYSEILSNYEDLLEKINEGDVPKAKPV